jgi:ribosomal-protein-alanine N-acetyltransferase
MQLPFKTYAYRDQLESQRIKTVFLKLTDSEEWSAFFEDQEATEFLGIEHLGLASHLEVSKHMIQKQLDRYNEQRFGLQKIIKKSDGSFIGLCGLLLQEVNGKLEVEIGYHFLRREWGNGYAVESAALFLDFALNVLGCSTVISIIDVKNFRSQKVAEKNGLRISETSSWLYGDEVFIFRKEIKPEK